MNDHRDGRSGWLSSWLGDSMVMLISQAALTGTSTLVMVLLARGLSTYQFGLFSSFLGLSQALSFVVDLGLGTWLLRECAQIFSGGGDPAEQRANVTGLLWGAISLVGAAGAVLVVLVTTGSIALGLPVELAGAQGAFMAYVVLLAGSTALEATLRAERRPRDVAAVVFVEKGVLLVLVILALIAGAGVAVIAIAHVFAGSIRLAIDHSRTLRGARKPGGVSIRSTMRRVGDSWPFALNSAVLSLLSRMDAALVALFSVVAASYFAIGFQIATTIALVPFIASTSLFPFLARTPRYQDRWRIAGLMAGAGVVVTACAVALAPTLIPLVFGKKYEDAVPTVQVMLVCMPAWFFASPLLTYLYAAKIERTVFKWVAPPSLIGSALVLLGPALVGPTGAAAGYGVRILLQAAALSLLTLRTRRSPPPAPSTVPA